MSEISDCENTLYRAISDLESVHAKIRLDGDRIAQLETENAKLKQQLQAMARLLKALPHDPTTEGMLHRDH